MLCGGPPCQGFSGMNRFNSREYSKFKVGSCRCIIIIKVVNKIIDILYLQKYIRPFSKVIYVNPELGRKAGKNLFVIFGLVYIWYLYVIFG